MASKKRPRSAREALARQRAEIRRSAPGKRFVGEAAEQSGAARLAEAKKVARMAERDAALRRAQAMGEPFAAIVAELVGNVVRLAGTLMVAPLRIARALMLRDA